MAEFSRLPHCMPTPPAENGFAGLACRIEGDAASYLAVVLDPGQAVEFDPSALLWREPSVTLGRVPGSVFLAARGPGQAGFARGLGGMIFPIPLAPGAVVQVARGQALLACGASQRDERSQGLGDRLTGNAGVAVERFTAGDDGGVVWVQARGAVFERALRPGELFDIQPHAFLCKDSTVVMETVYPIAQDSTGFDFAILRFTGPGRVAFQSAPEGKAYAAIQTATEIGRQDAARSGPRRGVAGALFGRRQG